MSRRITFFVLATSATLIATQASADRECFEDSCRLTDAPEAAQRLPSDETAAPEANAAVQAAAPVSAPPQAGLAPNALAPKTSKPLPEVVEAPVTAAPPQVAASGAAPLDVTPYPQVASPRIRPLRVAEPVVRQPPPPVQTFTDEAPLPRERAEVQPSREKAKPAQRYAKATQPAPVRVAHKPAAVAAVDEAPETVAAAPVTRPRHVRVSSTEPGYVQGYNQVAAPGIVVVVPPVTHLAGRYLFAPNAKIISIDTDD